MAAMKMGDIKLDEESKYVNILLSASKHDPQAKGAERPWKCICDEGTLHPHRSCPYHAVLYHWNWTRSHFSSSTCDDEQAFFVTNDGQEIDPSKILEFIEKIAEITNEALLNKMGGRRFGKHSFRATGAVHLSEMGLEVAKIMLLGRWQCMIVLRYCRAAPLKTIANEYKRGRKEAGSDTVDTLATKPLKSKAIAEMMAKICEEKLNELKALIAHVEQQSRPREYVVNRRTLKVHRALTYFAETGHEAIAYCGWPYGKGQARLMTELDTPPSEWRRICTTCMKEESEKLKKLAGE